MANENIKQNYRSIANAIRNKTGKNNSMTAEEMPAEIDSIEVGITPTGTIDITTNGDHDVAEYGTAHVAVPNPSKGTFPINSNGKYDVKNFEYVSVNVPLPPYVDASSNSYLNYGCNRTATFGGDTRTFAVYMSIDLSDLNDDMSNLSEVVDSQIYDEYGGNFKVAVILLNNIPTRYLQLTAYPNTWPYYYASRREELEEAFQNYGEITAYDICDHTIARNYISVSTDS